MQKTKYHLAYDKQPFVTMVDEKELSSSMGKEVTRVEDLVDVENMKKAINAHAFAGLHRAGFALAHHQVSKDHFRYFVIGDLWKGAFKDNTVIVNPEILEIPENTVEFRQGCLSHPYKDYKKVQTYDKLKVKFQNDKLEPVEMDLEGLPAMVFFHEWFHTRGKTIYTAEFVKPEDSKVMTEPKKE